MITDDGCAVGLYRQLRAGAEPEVVHAALPAGAGILELGAGTGRITHPLLVLGHPVVAVDFSAEMLAEIRGARTVLATIEELRLAERFDAVVLGSHLINQPDQDDRRAMLRTCRHHLRPTGSVLIEWHPPAWFDGLAPSAAARPGVERVLDGVGYRWREITRPAADLLSATIEYRVGPDRWTQSFTARRLTEADLVAQLAQVGLAFAGYLDAGRTWLRAIPANGERSTI
jgi:SAM-dependent methyltransferase